MKKSLALIPAILLLALGGCAAPESPVQAAESESATPSASPVAVTATIEDYLVAVMPVSRSVAEWNEKWDDAVCSALATEDDPICSTYIVTGSMIGGTVDATIGGSMKESAPAYIGAPPANLENLALETQEAGSTVSALGDEWREADCPGAESCIGTAFAIERGMSDLDDKFASWAVYK